jgi:hypothetical protein
MSASVPLLIQYQAVMTRREHLAASRFSVSDVEDLLDAVAMVAEPVRLDDMVLETAGSGRAEAIVTYHRRHFASLRKQIGIEVLSPAARTSTFALRLQPSLLDEACQMAAEGVALNRLINVAVAEKLSALRTEKYFADRAARANIPKARCWLSSRSEGGASILNRLAGPIIELPCRLRVRRLAGRLRLRPRLHKCQKDSTPRTAPGAHPRSEQSTQRKIDQRKFCI